MSSSPSTVIDLDVPVMAQRACDPEFEGDSAQEAILLADHAGIVLKANRAFIAISGDLGQKLIGQSLESFRAHKDAPPFYTRILEILSHQGEGHTTVWIRTRDVDVRPYSLSLTKIDSGDGEPFLLVQLRQSKEPAQRSPGSGGMAIYDPVTELPNRRFLIERLSGLLDARKQSGTFGSLIAIDLIDMKGWKSSHGHAEGDLFLKHVAHRLRDVINGSDILTRSGSDEFVVLTGRLMQDQNGAFIAAKSLCESILAAFREPFDFFGTDHLCSLSIGICLLDETLQSPEGLLRQAEIAMHESKLLGGNGFKFFDPSMQAALEARVSLERELKQALPDGQLRLHYQPQVDLRGQLTGFEALLRWQHPVFGLMYPSEFIHLTEANNLVIDQGSWVLENACHQLAAWAHDVLTCNYQLGVNISAVQFNAPDFPQKLQSILEKTGASPDRLRLELTESVLLEDLNHAVSKMQALKAIGVSLSLDDFGTGYSSLAYLKHLPIDELKIAQPFVRDILTDDRDWQIIQTILNLGQNLHLEVIAEGVETEAQWQRLKEIGCTRFQGYLFGKPAPLEPEALSS